MIVYLVRHAHVRNPKKIMYGRLPGYPLSLRGRKAAKRTGKFLKNKHIEIIFTSPMQRTLETAEFIQQRIGIDIPLETTTDLLEGDFGRYDGLPMRKIDHELTDDEYLERDPNIERTYNGETLRQMGERVGSFVLKIVKSHKYKTAVFVSHRDPILSAIWLLMNKKLISFFEKDLPRGGVWKLNFRGEKAVSAKLIYHPEEGK